LLPNLLISRAFLHQNVTRPTINTARCRKYRAATISANTLPMTEAKHTSQPDWKRYTWIRRIQRPTDKGSARPTDLNCLSLTPHKIVTGPPSVRAIFRVVLDPYGTAMIAKLSPKTDTIPRFLLSSCLYPISLRAAVVSSTEPPFSTAAVAAMTSLSAFSVIA
jgi:hypothetical protein